MPADRVAAILILTPPGLVALVLVLHAVLPWLAWVALVLAEAAGVLA